ncbi:MAG: hypothetical protein LBQ48_07680 [Oscillospiraceae bacterium]|jgi:DNA repair ATPase RecN|nr:hypothetical protein [Oscillospiraceae bacterium]
MDREIKLRSAINGYNKTDVEQYIDTIVKEYENQVGEFKRRFEEAMHLVDDKDDRCFLLENKLEEYKIKLEELANHERRSRSSEENVLELLNNLEKAKEEIRVLEEENRRLSAFRKEREALRREKEELVAQLDRLRNENRELVLQHSELENEVNGLEFAPEQSLPDLKQISETDSLRLKSAEARELIKSLEREAANMVQQVSELYGEAYEEVKNISTAVRETDEIFSGAAERLEGILNKLAVDK